MRSASAPAKRTWRTFPEIARDVRRCRCAPIISLRLAPPRSSRKLRAMKPKTLILRTAGTNCDGETVYAFERAGAVCEKIHVNRLLEDRALLGGYQILAIPGGFSYGDDIAARRIFANQIRHPLSDPLRTFIDARQPTIG